MQREQVELAIPEPVLYVPVGHDEQVATVIPVPVPYVPAAQREHTEIPVSEL